MKMQVKEQIKTLLAQKNIKLKDLAQKMTEKTNKKYTLDGLSHKMRRGTVTYNEILLMSEILGYEIMFINKDAK